MDNFQPHVHADSLHVLLKVEASRRERYPENSIFGNSKDTKESTVPICPCVFLLCCTLVDVYKTGGATIQFVVFLNSRFRSQKDY